MLMYDESRPETLQHVLSWAETAINRYLDEEDVKPIVILVGNAFDQPAGCPNVEALPAKVLPFFFHWFTGSVRCQPNQILQIVHRARIEPSS